MFPTIGPIIFAQAQRENISFIFDFWVFFFIYRIAFDVKEGTSDGEEKEKKEGISNMIMERGFWKCDSI